MDDYEYTMDDVAEASERVAYLVLLSLCYDNETTVQQAMNIIKKHENTVKKMANTRSRKRKFGDDTLTICADCKQIYSTEERSNKKAASKKGGDEICVFHSGELEPDYRYDYWAFFYDGCSEDENCHERVKSLEFQLKYPDGYLWTCCDEQNGSTPGCEERSHHRPLVKPQASGSSEAQMAG